MVERAILNQRIIDEAEPPATGERWIADTQIKGFGLRLWRDSSGKPQKAYGVRVSDPNGRSIRRTLRLWDAYFLHHRHEFAWNFPPLDPENAALGEGVRIARSWAYDEINRIKGKPTLAEEDEEQKRVGKERASTLSLEQAVKAIIKGMEFEGLSLAYRDRLQKLFDIYVASSVPAIANKRACEITLDDVAKVLNTLNTKPGNIRILRPLLRRALEIPFNFGVETKSSPYGYLDLGDRVAYSVSFPPKLRHWKRKQFFDLLDDLTEDNERWQQAACIRLYLTGSAPLSQIMAARRDDIFPTQISDPFGTDDTTKNGYIWQYARGWKGREIIRGTTANLIQRCFELGEEQFVSPYLFPSKFGARGHIRSVEYVWRETLIRHDLGLVTPRSFRLAFKEATHWHDIWRWENGEGNSPAN